jgi:hypothetical protein
MNRRALTLLELVIVFAVIAVLLSLLFPAVQSVRQSARDTVCKNNLYQMNLAFEQYSDLNKRLPLPSQPGIVGGWKIELLPFLEQVALKDSIVTGISIASAPSELFRRPSIFTCPVRAAMAPDLDGEMQRAHYVFAANAERDTAWFSDAPIPATSAWAECPEKSITELRSAKGPHHGGFYFAPIFQGVKIMIDGEIVRD